MTQTGGRATVGRVAPRRPHALISRITARPETGGLVVAGALTCLALALRWTAVHQSLFGDELFLYAIVHDRSLGQAMSAIHDTEKTPPLFFLMTWAVDRVGGEPELLRLPSVLAGVATVLLTYLLGLRTLGRPAALLAAAMLALSSFQIVYATEARGYALVSALVLTSTLALLHAVEERRARWWVLYGLAALAAAYTHYIAALVLVPQALWALWAHRDSLREQLAVHALAVLAYLPWLPSFLVQRDHSSEEARRISDIFPLTLHNFGETLTRATIGSPFVQARQLPGRAAVLLALAVLAIGLVSAAMRVAAGRRAGGGRARPRPASILVVLLALVPPATIVLISLRPDSSFLLARNLIVAVPYGLLLAGWLLTSARPPALAVALSTLALGVLAVGTVQTYRPEHRRTDGRRVAHFINAHAKPGDHVLDLQYPFTGPPARAVQIYLDPSLRLGGDPDLAWQDAVTSHRSMFLSFPDVVGFRLLVVAPAAYASRFRLVTERRFPGLRPLRVREYAPR